MDEVDFFGATVVHKRTPFSDIATKNRAIIIRTAHRPGNYAIKEVTNKGVIALAEVVRQEQPIFTTSDRIHDTWRPLITVAMVACDKNWLDYSFKQIQLETQQLLAGYGYEPEDALIYSLQALFNENKVLNKPQAIRVSKLREHLRDEFDIRLKNYQIEEMCRNLGFQVTKPHGYPTVQPDEALLQELLDKIKPVV